MPKCLRYTCPELPSALFRHRLHSRRNFAQLGEPLDPYLPHVNEQVLPLDDLWAFLCLHLDPYPEEVTQFQQKACDRSLRRAVSTPLPASPPTPRTYLPTPPPSRCVIPAPATAPAPAPPRQRIMPDFSKSFAELEKLKDDGSNYRSWCAKIGFLVRAAHGAQLMTRAPLAANQDEQNLNDEVSAAIAVKLPQTAFNKIMMHTTLHEIIATLDKDYNLITPTMKSALEQEFRTLKCSKDNEIDAHLNNMVDYRNCLSEYGTIMDDTMFINTIVASIPADYRQVIEEIQLANSDSNSKMQTFKFRDSLAGALANVNNAAGNRIAIPAFVPTTISATDIITALHAKAKSNLTVSKSDKKDGKKATEQANYNQHGNNQWNSG